MGKTEKNQIAYLNWAKGLGIFFVMLGHISPLSNPITTWGNSFKLIIFFVVSGYLFSMKDNRELTTKEFVIKKLKSLGIPYVAFSLLALIAQVVYGLCNGDSVVYVLFRGIYAIFSLKGISTLWFLPVLFIAEIFYFMIHKKKIKCQILAVTISVVFIFGFQSLYILLLAKSELSIVMSLISWPCMVIEKSLIAFLVFALSVQMSKKILNLPLPILAVGGFAT